jgi:hypothetical protein
MLKNLGRILNIMEDDQRERRELARSPNLPPRYDETTHYNDTPAKKPKKVKLKKSMEAMVSNNVIFW